MIKRLVLLTVIFGGLFYGCRTTYRPVSDAEIRAAMLERRVGETIEQLETITAEAEGIGNRVDRIIYLFDEYDKCVRELIEEYRKLKNEAVILEKSNID